MTPLYVLNPGDGFDVQTFDSFVDAHRQLNIALASDHPHARLYAIVPPGALDAKTRFQRYERGSWYDVDRSLLQIKIVELDRFPTPEVSCAPRSRSSQR